MIANPFLGVFLHAIGGFAAGTFYLPYKKVKGWSWESYWLVGGFFSWIIAPIIFALFLNPRLFEILSSAPLKAIFFTYLFGAMWGIGGLTYGLTMRYLGLSLGVAVTLGFCAAFGTIIPPLFKGELIGLMQSLSGLVTLGGIVVCLGGIAMCGQAGTLRERELTQEQKAVTSSEFNFIKGLWIAVFSGIMSSCMAFAFQAGKPIMELAQDMGTSSTFSNTPVLIITLLGGFTTNFIWCVFLNVKNKSYGDYLTAPQGAMLANYLFSAIAGTTWYLQFFFYGMGTTKMGEYDFSSWTLHMSFIIIFGNLWGIVLKEWLGTSKRTHVIIVAGIIILILSTIVVGFGNYLATLK
ncbi:MAG TPA: L-rhamnose/proton symporter RhaT [Candidatus Hydrogenedentes bacterium]|nr:L-rhamnose/proton symporter RhaT [Candidatus Hydrogenedentota bacterium]